MDKAAHRGMTPVPWTSHAGYESWFSGSCLAINDDLEAVTTALC